MTDLTTDQASRASELLRALAEDEADIDDAFQEGLYDSLDSSKLALARDQSYPLSIGKVRDLSGATERQIRHWEEQGLLRSYPLGGQRRYLRGGVLRAMALVQQEPTLGKARKRPASFLRLLGLALRGSGDKGRC